MESALEPSPNQPLERVTPLDVLEAEMSKHPQLDCPLVHRFTPGLYIREIFMPAGSLITSVLHKTCHPFVISKGDVSVYEEGREVARHQAPYTGVTQPGTRRLLYMHEDTIWTTFHPTDKTDPDEIVQEITETEINPLLPKNFIQGWRQKPGQPLIQEVTT
jgi:hypothetical protein